MPDHERWKEAQVKGANCIGIAIVKKENLDSVEKMMIKKYKPILNEQYK